MLGDQGAFCVVCKNLETDRRNKKQEQNKRYMNNTQTNVPPQRRLAHTVAQATLAKKEVGNPRVEFPSLLNIALDQVAKHFDLYPHLDGLRAYYKDQIIKKIKINYPITITAPHVEDEAYWKKSCEARWKLIKLEDHGFSYKNAYLEKHAQDCFMQLKVMPSLSLMLGNLSGRTRSNFLLSSKNYGKLDSISSI